MNLNFVHFKKIDSTNSEALRRLSLCASPRELYSFNKTVFVAEEQTAGRGRVGRSFYSPAESGIYFSAVYAPEEPLPEPAVLTAGAAVAVCRSLKEVYGLDSKIKWVNDIYSGQKKICGILTEGHLSKDGKIDAAVVGIGINITTGGFPKEIKERAGSVFLGNEAAAKKAGDTRMRLVESVCDNLFEIYLGSGSVKKEAMEEYKARSFLVGKTVQVSPVIGGTESYAATVLGIDGNARLLVRTESGEERALNSGEVSVLVSGSQAATHE